MLAPNRIKIFGDTELTAECHSMNCSQCREAPKNWGEDYVCNAGGHGECPKVNITASEINQFIADNEDVLNLIECVGE